jgi:hypothetical protein
MPKVKITAAMGFFDKYRVRVGRKRVGWIVPSRGFLRDMGSYHFHDVNGEKFCFGSFADVRDAIIAHFKDGDHNASNLD